MSLPADHPEELLPWYVNGTLSPEERQRVEAHLDQCPSCRGEVQALRSLRREIKGVTSPIPMITGVLGSGFISLPE